MLSDEEKQAIKELIDSNNLSLIGDGTCINSRRTIGTILNLIEKHSKEIEELKEKDDANLAYYDQIYQNGIYTGKKAVEDKIKAKIEEQYDKKSKARLEMVYLYRYTIAVLQSLLPKE